MQCDGRTHTFGQLIEQRVLEVGDGYRAKNDELGGNGLIFLRAGHVTDTHIDLADAERFIYTGREKFGPKVARPGDVVVTTKGNSTGRVAFVAKDMPPFVYSPHLSYWRSRSATVLRAGFLRAWSRGQEFVAQLEAMSRSTDMAPYLSLSDQHRLRITLPPIDVQVGIAELGDAIEARIDLLRQTNATLESIAQALFKSWFIDFDPVRAKAEGREPEGMDAATAALFPAEFEESALGLIPKGWRVGTVRDVCSIFDSKRIPLSGRERAERQGPYPYYGAAALMDHVDDFLFDGVYLLLGEDGSVTNTDGTPITQYVWGKFWVNNHAHVLQGTHGVRTEHLMLALRCMDFTPYVTGAVQAKLNQSNLFRVPFLRAALKVSEAFGLEVEPLYRRFRANSERAMTLATLRDTLLPRLISGKLRLPEAEAVAAEVAAG
jgi:type I restriction enzyme S subunit